MEATGDTEALMASKEHLQQLAAGNSELNELQEHSEREMLCTADDMLWCSTWAQSTSEIIHG